MQILVTGASGFVGNHVLKELADHGHAPVALSRHQPANHARCAAVHLCDITHHDAVDQLIRTTRPDACIHLAAESFVPNAATNPSAVFQINTVATVNLLNAFQRHAPHARILLVSTSHVYGHPATSQPLHEDAPFRPQSQYAASKCAAEMAAISFFEEHGLNIFIARPGNHTGPGQGTRFVVPAFAEQLHKIKSGQIPPALTVGNLDSIRDFSDVRDVARAYRLLLDKGQPGLAYNISSCNRMPIRQILEQLAAIAGVHPEIHVSPQLYRPTNATPPLDINRLRTHTGWAPTIDFESTLRDTFNHRFLPA